MNFKTRQLTFKKTSLSLIYRDDSDTSVIDEIFVDRLYRCVEDIIPELNNPILDIGAHIGLFSIYARILNPEIDIIALEPEPTNFDILKINIKQNHTKNITSRQIALTHTDDKKIPLYISADSHNHSTTSPNHSTTEPLRPRRISLGRINHIMVPATTLDKVISKYNLDTIGLLKMDIEGAEYEILKNMKHATWNTIQNLVLEYHNNQYDHKHLEQLIREHGFSVAHFPSPFDKRYGLFLCRNKRM